MSKICKFDGCNREFKPVVGRQIYCFSDECKLERERVRHRERRKRVRESKVASEKRDREL